MSIRLNKAIRELNIGLQTAVEFLEKKPNLGEVKGDPNFKLSDAQYEALATQFNKDKQVKAIADKKFPKKSKEGGKKKQSQGGVKRGDDGLTKIQAYTPLGKIDLDQLNRKPGQKTDQKPKADQPKAKEEKPVRKQEPQQHKQEQPKPIAVDYIAECEKTLSKRLSRGVRIVNGKRKGRVELEYYGEEDLQQLYELLERLGERRSGRYE